MADMKVEILETQGSVPAVEPQKVAPVTPAVKAEEPKYVRLEDLEKVNQAINNTREYNNRQLAEIKQALADLKPKEPVKPADDLDELVQQDWKAGVRGVARQVLEEERRKASTITDEQRVMGILEESKKKVMERHPELSDPNSAKAQEFLKILDENPDFKANPRGPMLAAYEMENRLKAHDTIESREKPQVKETRARAASIPAGTSPGTKTAYSLSKADMDFCRLNNINPENYKRFKGMKEVS